jgi:quercetin dioxygenase-like cupin family protein
MRLLTLGTNESGHSVLVEARELDLEHDVGQAVCSHMLVATHTFPPEVGVARRAATDAVVQDVGLGENGTKWTIVHFAAGAHLSMHRTDTLDLFVVLDGEVELLLEADEVPLRQGDTFALPGLVHGWRAGARPCTVSVVMLPLAKLP